MVAQILEHQETNGMEAVSGSTCTSDATVQAVSKALSEALQ
ncbi:MAG: FMN-binding protein [Ruminococcus sp.]